MKNVLNEILLCAESPSYFIDTYVKIYDSGLSDWIPFRLWPEQKNLIDHVHANQLTIIVKARQLGITWCVLGYTLWSMLFDPAAEAMLYSRRDDEAIHLLDNRLKGMYNRLPDELKSKKIVASNTHTFGLSNGSTARAFPTTAGDSYTATIVMVDEADLTPDFNKLMRAVKPTIDNGGKMVLLSRVNKDTPQSEFKRIYRASVKGATTWTSIFLPWYVHPGRDAQWYENQKQDIILRTTSLDDLYEQYPSTPEEALLPSTMDKRVPGKWLMAQYRELTPLEGNGFIFFSLPTKWRQYVIGADPAEGNPTSDDSCAIVLDKLTGEEVAIIAGKYQPSIFAAMITELSIIYNNAPILVERNNHGHAVILYFVEFEPDVDLLDGYDDKVGWLNNSFGKSQLYTSLVDNLRDEAVTIHHETTFHQLSSIDGKKLAAPPGEFDDYATAFALANKARELDTSSNFELVLGGSNLYVPKITQYIK